MISASAKCSVLSKLFLSVLIVLCNYKDTIWVAGHPCMCARCEDVKMCCGDYDSTDTLHRFIKSNRNVDCTIL